MFFIATRVPEIIQPCNPSPCGVNAECREQSNAAACTCIRDYQGNPYIECKPECVSNSDCPRHLVCLNQKCVDPCKGICGDRATCSVTNHIPLCTCYPGYTGDAFIACRRITTCESFTSKVFLLKLHFSTAKNRDREDRPMQPVPLWVKR